MLPGTVRSPRFILWLVCLAAWAGTYAADKSPAAMADAATKFLATLPPEQRGAATFAFGSTGREHWGYLPSEMFPRQGLTIGAMTPAQRAAAHDLLKAGLSRKGYLTANAIMELEAILDAIENPPGAPRASGGSRATR